VQSLRVFYASGLEVEFGLASLQWASAPPVDEESARVMRDGAVILVDKQLRLAQLAGSMDTENILIRELQDSDSIEELTVLLHRAYKRLLDMGLRYWATHQTVDDTRTRIAGGKCLVAVLNGRIVGTVTYQYPPRWRDTPWYMRADVACVSQFAVEPDCQRRGIGGALMTRVEALAIHDGAAELALSTAEPAVHLVDYYARRGYRLVEHTDATLPHYRSVILSKRLIERPAKEIAIRPYQASDARSLWEAARESLSDIHPWMPWCHPDYTVEEAQAWYQVQAEAWANRTFYEFAITSSDGHYLGACGVNQLDAVNRRANLGYWVRSSAAGQGVAPAAVKLLSEWAFEHTDLIRLEILVATGNIRSLRVAEKAGAEREGILRKRLLLHGEAHDAILLSLTR